MAKIYNPPINSKSTDELQRIINKSSDWEIDAVEQARTELVKRGISVKEQIKKRDRKIRNSNRLRKIKESATLSKSEAVLYFIFAPIGLALTLFIFKSFGTGPDPAYKKIFKQKIFLIILGIIFWIGVIAILI